MDPFLCGNKTSHRVHRERPLCFSPMNTCSTDGKSAAAASPYMLHSVSPDQWDYGSALTLRKP